MGNKQNMHVPVLDGLRALAALSVCFFHFVCGPTNFVTDETVLDIFSYGKYGVQLFFVISGFVIPWSIATSNYHIKKYFHFLLKRFIRLEPPYICSIVMIVALIYLRTVYTDAPDIRVLSPNQLFLHLGYLIPFSNYDWIIDVYWTLAIEFQFYLFMGLFYFIIISKSPVVRIAGYISVLSLSFIGTNDFLPYWLPVFLIGNLLFLFISERIKAMEFYITISLVAIYLAFWYPLPILFASIIPTLALLFCFSYYNKILTWLGKISYSIYLFHTIVGTATINVLSHHVHSSFMKFIIVMVGIGVSIVFSYIMYRIIEVPSKKLSAKIKY